MMEAQPAFDTWSPGALRKTCRIEGVGDPLKVVVKFVARYGKEAYELFTGKGICLPLLIL